MSKSENPKRQKLRNNEYYDFQRVQDDLYAKSQNGYVFKDLMSKIISEANILLAYRNIKKNTGSNTKGTDGKTIASLAKLEPKDLIALVRRKLENYQPQKVRRVEIPKPDGKTRPLGIPTISDRLVQQCILQVMEPICEAKFYKHSYGFRPLRSTKHAIARAYFLAQAVNLHYVVDVDIKGFFDNIDHGKLLKQIWTLGIRDKSLLAVISKLLKAEIEGIGIPTKGTPQGGIISPLLANIALNEYDHWIKSQWEEMITEHTYSIDKYGSKTKMYRALKTTNLKEVYIVRYADDFKLFCRNYSDAIKIFEATKKWLKERLKLEISPEKSKIVNLRKNYSDFLGIKLKVTKKRKDKNNKDKFVVQSQIGNKAYQKIVATIREHAKKMQKPKDNKGGKAVYAYNSYVLGVHNYYNCATNCNIDFSKIASITRSTLRNRLYLRKKKANESIPKYMVKSYGKSEQLRFVYNTPILPIGYIQHQKAFQYSGYTPYIASDREEIHKNQKAVNTSDLKYLMENPIQGQSVEYNDNRTSLFVGQYGKCYITDKPLNPSEMHCHHKKPRALNGTDEYKNLVIIEENIHRLVHATKEETIKEYIQKLNLTTKQLEKVNKLREQAKLLVICN
ncbi:group II intron reverse transcriptase/maturase [Aliarcobacter butzleri]|uniref:group II intron reverse transcriptase/maturase n=1 Tax=Aliarcobacter butzleri TaxID=28197 RepID=UPI001EDC3373|nr:group II intron reverse transcriptase/maturase [Aliarcobacter butzleri]MCG3655378.1 group II intron reverse transcriptase/maturase [Aliarcobacter butzleri]